MMDMERALHHEPARRPNKNAWLWRLVVFALLYPFASVHLFCSLHLRYYGNRHDNEPEGYCQQRWNAWNEEAGLVLIGFGLPLLLATCVALVGIPSRFWCPLQRLQNLLQQCLNKMSCSVQRIPSGCCGYGTLRHVVRNETFVAYVLLLVPILWMLWDTSGPPISKGLRRVGHPFLACLLQATHPTGYAAVWPLALFLLPVTKQSVLLDALQISPVTALAFHRAAGWISLWFSILHGILEITSQVLVVVLEGSPPQDKSLWEILVYLLIPHWSCWEYQVPWTAWQLYHQYGHNKTGIFNGRHGGPPCHYGSANHTATPENGTRQCVMSFYNFSGTISTLAFLVLALFSLPLVRRRLYAWFYAIHIPMAWIMMVTAIIHYRNVAIFLLPNLLYYLVLTVPVHVQLWWNRIMVRESFVWEAQSIDNGKFVEVTFLTTGTNPFESPFLRLWCPQVSMIWHPFSIVMPRKSPTYSILFRAVGPFTKGLADAVLSEEEEVPTILVDAFCAGSYQWVDKSTQRHDHILLVAGGVGIVPFLNFLPQLWQTCDDADGVTTASLQRVELHWYCREPALAVHVWQKYMQFLAPSTPDGIEFAFHLHLTSLCECTDDEATAHFHQRLSSYSPPQAHRSSAAVPVEGSRLFSHRWLVAFWLSITLCLGFCCLWWWYYFTLRIGRLFTFVRSYSLVALILATVLVSVLIEVLIRRKSELEYRGRQVLMGESDLPYAEEVESPQETALNGHLQIHGGRPLASQVVACLQDAEFPAVFQCGPVSLMKSIEDEVKAHFGLAERCSFYKENSDL